jgi:hypothetical protein
MSRQPDRWITVRDADGGTPVPGISLVYMQVKKPYWIVGAVMRCREYVAGPDRRAHVPSGVILRPSGSDYVVAFDKVEGGTRRQLTNAEVLWVRTIENDRMKRQQPPPCSGDHGTRTVLAPLGSGVCSRMDCGHEVGFTSSLCA